MVTNGTRAQQSRKMRFTGLDNLVDGIVISESAGAKKPEPEIFRQALEYRADNSTVWMVGANADADIRGAQKLGLSTGWVSHEKSWEGTDSPTIIQPTTVRVLEEIHLGR
ncbi:HAD family hydrolase [Salinibacterium sp. UTAS2018]|uniref:HAD family hydrolase n=1 Tax=Salinibacterium sp. UTAS2018 TaxID=2508880 RepID=UPI00143DA893